MFDMFFHFVIFLFGLIVGSFLNCVIYRLALHQNIGEGLKGRSYCPYCQHLLSWQDLIPVLSFIFLKGKCRYCQKSISLQYPLIELATGLIFLLIVKEDSFFSTFASINGSSVFNFQFLSTLSPFITTLYLFIISSFLIVIFVYDLKHYIIPDKIIYPAIVIAFLYNIYQFTINNFLSAFGAAIFFLIIVLISQGKWMGVGDIKLAFLMGLILSFPGILIALFLAFFIGAVIGLGLIISKKKTLKSEIPFGPFLVTGTFLALFWGNELINWYQGLFLIQ